MYHLILGAADYLAYLPELRLKELQYAVIFRQKESKTPSHLAQGDKKSHWMIFHL